MTAEPKWDTVDPQVTDAELVRGSMAGDRAAFAQIYDRYADRLYDFCVGMLRDFDGAADCVQETFCVAATRLHQLRDPDRLRPWLYSIARNEALRRLRERRRETPSEELPDVQSDDAGPDTLSARGELADLIAEVSGGLSERDRALLDLTFRHGLDGAELADALGVSHTNANTMVHRLRGTVERSLGALLVSRRAKNTVGACAELRQILAGWDGQFTVLMRKRVARHIESCATCDEERRRLVSPAALLGAAPILVPAPAWLREHTLGEVQLTCAGSALEDDSVAGAQSGGADTGALRRRRMLLAAVLVAVLAVSAALLLASNNEPPTAITPTEADEVLPPAPIQAPTPRNAVPPSQPPQAPSMTPPPALPPVPVNVPPPVFVPTQEAPSPEAPQVVDPPPQVVPPSKPPMSFAPTVIATPPAPPPSGDGGGRRAGGP